MFVGELACPLILGSHHVCYHILMAARQGEPYQVREPDERMSPGQFDWADMSPVLLLLTPMLPNRFVLGC